MTVGGSVYAFEKDINFNATIAQLDIDGEMLAAKELKFIQQITKLNVDGFIGAKEKLRFENNAGADNVLVGGVTAGKEIKYKKQASGTVYVGYNPPETGGTEKAPLIDFGNWTIARD
jgi:hypothetical protein